MLEVSHDFSKLEPVEAVISQWFKHDQAPFDVNEGLDILESDVP